MKQLLEPQVLSVLFEQISLLLRAGAQPEEAVCLLTEEDSSLAPLLTPIRDRMLRGYGFSAAVTDCGIFPAYAVGLIAVGETAGRLEDCLQTLSDYYVRQLHLQQRLKTALLYPAALLLLMSVVLAVLVLAVLPVFSRVYESLSGSLLGGPYLTAASVIGRIALILTVLVCAFALVASGAAGSNAAAKKIQSALARLPGIGAALRLLAVSSFCDILATLLSSGMNPDSALETAYAMNEHPALGQSLAACMDATQAGTGLATALCQQPIFSPLHRRILVTGAASGKLSETFSELADQTSQEGQRALLLRIDMAEPILTTFLTIAVGLSLLSAMLPLIGILGVIG